VETHGPVVEAKPEKKGNKKELVPA